MANQWQFQLFSGNPALKNKCLKIDVSLDACVRGFWCRIVDASICLWRHKLADSKNLMYFYFCNIMFYID